MRQGPIYSQWIHRNERDEITLPLPLEFEEEWEDFQFVDWKDNGDGTYTLIPRNTT